MVAFEISMHWFISLSHNLHLLQNVLTSKVLKSEGEGVRIILYQIDI